MLRDEIKKITKFFGSTAKLAKACGVSRQALNTAMKKGKLSPKLASEIKSVTGIDLSDYINPKTRSFGPHLESLGDARLDGIMRKYKIRITQMSELLGNTGHCVRRHLSGTKTKERLNIGKLERVRSFYLINDSDWDYLKSVVNKTIELPARELPAGVIALGYSDHNETHRSMRLNQLKDYLLQEYANQCLFVDMRGADQIRYQDFINCLNVWGFKRPSGKALRSEIIKLKRDGSYEYSSVGCLEQGYRIIDHSLLSKLSFSHVSLIFPALEDLCL